MIDGSQATGDAASKWKAIDRTDGDYRATVFPSGETSQRFQTIATGWSMEAALAFCLAQALGTARPIEDLASV